MKEDFYGIEGYTEEREPWDKEKVLQWYIKRAMRYEIPGIEGLTGDETTLCAEGVKWSFPELTEEEAEEVASRFNEMLEEAKASRAADKYAKDGVTAEEVKYEGNVLEKTTPQIIIKEDNELEWDD